MAYIVYKHTSPSGKVYIGITSLRPEERWGGGAGYVKNKHFNRAIKKYGWENIKHEILFDGLSGLFPSQVWPGSLSDLSKSIVKGGGKCA